MSDKYNMKMLEKNIGYEFKDIELLQQALTHSSYTNEQKIRKTNNYERLEFLGDAVLELISSEYLFQEKPNVLEGELTKMRASMVCEPTLAFCAKDLELGHYMLLGRGEEVTGGRERDSITSDCMEALIGAIYIDSGIESARDFINRFILSDLDDKQLFYDSKTNLQELMQGKLKMDFRYELIEESGPEHDKTFKVEVISGSEILGEGSGRTKKAAEQQAAYKTLLFFRKRGLF